MRFPLRSVSSVIMLIEIEILTPETRSFVFKDSVFSNFVFPISRFLRQPLNDSIASTHKSQFSRR